MGTPERLAPIQRAFVDGYASQCGYCTSGMMTDARAPGEHVLEHLRIAVAPAEVGI